MKNGTVPSGAARTGEGITRRESETGGRHHITNTWNPKGDKHEHVYETETDSQTESRRAEREQLGSRVTAQRRERWTRGASWPTVRLKHYRQRSAAPTAASKTTRREGTREAKRSSEEASQAVEDIGQQGRGERHVQLSPELQSYKRQRTAFNNRRKQRKGKD